MKKYKITKETLIHKGYTLHRIKATKSFGNVKKGELGGWIENEDNLSKDGNCWIFKNAKVYGGAVVHGNATVSDNAEVFGNSDINENSTVINNAQINSSYITNFAVVGGNAKVIASHIFNYSNVGCNAEISTSSVKGNVYNNVIVTGSDICEGTNLYDDARVINSIIKDRCNICGKALIEDVTIVYGTNVRGDAVINKRNEYYTFTNFWSSGRYFTWTKSNDKWAVGCFFGSGKELIEKAYKDSKLSGDYYKACVDFVETLKMVENEKNT